MSRPKPRAPRDPERFHNPWDALLDASDLAFGDHADQLTEAEYVAALELYARALDEVRDRTMLDAIARGTTHAELAAVLGISRQAISQRVHHARDREIRRARQRRAEEADQ
jgi:CRP-like cAMP-binding protein